ncbi:MAG: glycosyltransferase [Verrucomicrobiota bacterium]
MLSPEFPISAVEDPLEVSGKFFRAGGEVCWIKAVTFGPFPAGAFPDEGMCELKRIGEELGANAIRLYEIPSLEFMHRCAEVGLRVFITLPWSQHIDFTKERRILEVAEQLLEETVLKFRGHPALAGYLVGNEIETTLVRWMGPRRVLEAIENLIAVGRANDSKALFSYANYPSTEYLIPANQDFFAFNLYLENPQSFQAYLARLQCLAGNKPLLVSEFGADSKSHGELDQAGILEWHIDEAIRGGAAGTTLFAWSDQWRRGGKEVEGWDFGLTRRDRSPKPSMEVVREKWLSVDRPSRELLLDELPSISVVVCTFRGVATLVECLDSLVMLDYPNAEIIVVNDGGDERVEELVSTYDMVRHVSVPHEGLGAARNHGFKASSGEIVVYTDDDCRVESDWLHWIVWQFQHRPELGCAGGPNIPPPAETMREAVLAATPGAATHVLLTDDTAEHLPGCNLGVRREVFEEVGGFNPRFWKAGDDVDFCWRVIDAGYELGFHAAAFVWHHRRATGRAFLRQQIGYGRSEALLMPLFPERFTKAGGASWKGRVYEPPATGGHAIYHGHFGYAPFQLVYPTPGSGLREVCLHLSWWLVMVMFTGAMLIHWAFGVLAGLMIGLSLLEARKRAAKMAIEPEFDSLSARWWLSALILAQGITRSGSRVRFGWRRAAWWSGLRSVLAGAGREVMSTWWKLGIEKEFWNESGKGRDELLAVIAKAFPGATVDESGKTDLIVREGLFWRWSVLTVTEFHEDEKRLTRLRLLAKPRVITRVLALLLILLLPAAAFTGFFGNGPTWLYLLGAYLTGEIAARIFMWQRRPRFSELAWSIGLKPI